MAVASPPEGPVEPPTRRRSTRRWIIGGIVVVILGVGAFLAFGYFEFQTLFLDEKVSEPAPAFSSGAAGSEVTVAATGRFTKSDHDGKGVVNLLTDGKQTFVRFEKGFATSNGPDLHAVAYVGDRRVDLGGLKGNLGSQNYELPSEVDPASVTSVAVWCKRFDATFTEARLRG